MPAPSTDPTRYNTNLVSVTASGSDDAWAVGTYNEPREGARSFLELQHWDGTRWTMADPPALESYGGLSLMAVATAGPGDAWAVGFDETERGGVPLALHWDGTSWARSPTPDTGEPESHLFNVAALAGDDVWAVGGWARPGRLQGGSLIMHWDGSRWTSDVQPTTPHPPSESGGPYDLLNGVAGTSRADVWAVGQAQDVPKSQSRTFTLHWDGSQWVTVASPNVTSEPGTGKVDNALQAVAALAPDDAWAVGSYRGKGDRPDAAATDRPLALHWDGTSWSIVPVPDVGQGSLNGIAAVAANDVWAVGQMVVNSDVRDYSVTPLLLHWDGIAWSRVIPPAGGDAHYLSAVTAVPGGGLWAVGNQGLGSPSMSLVLRCG